MTPYLSPTSSPYTSPHSPPPASPSLHDCLHESDIAILKSAVIELKEATKRISDLLTSNAVLSEQLLEVNRKMNDNSIRLSTLETALAYQRGSHKWLDKIVWSVCSAALGALVVAQGLAL